jgi:putative transcriptional regulator
MSLGELAKSQELSIARSRERELIHVGGPVEPYRGFVLHDSTTIEERAQVLPGLFVSVTSDALGLLLTDPSPRVRFCLGYAGWGPGQVEAEIAHGSWLFTEAVPDTVLSVDPVQVWGEVIKSMGVDPAMLVTTGGIN